MILSDVNTFEYSPLSLLRIYKVLVQSEETECLLHVVYKPYGQSNQIAMIRYIPLNNKIEFIKKSYMQNLNQRQWVKEIRGQCISELFKCYILRNKYYLTMLDILSIRKSHIHCLNFDGINNLLIIGYKHSIEIWSLRKGIMCKKYEVNEGSIIIALESMISHKLSEDCPVNYKVAVRLIDWTILVITDFDLRRNKAKYSIKKLYGLSQQSIKNFNSSYGLYYVKKCDTLLYPKINGSICMYSISESNVSLSANYQPNPTENTYNIVHNLQYEVIWVYNVINKISELC